MEAAVPQPLARPSAPPRRGYDRRSRARESHVPSPVRLVTASSPEAQEIEGVLPRERSEIANRILNVVIASLALALVAPLLAMVAIAVKLTSPGPILYRQTRVGVDRRFRRGAPYDRRAFDHGGKPFRIYKFRSMRVDAERHGPVWASPDDGRVTPIGRILRKTRLDELPQLYNVLRGDMNIVGPRPERPKFVVEMRRSIPQYQFRQRVKPGITGWAQVNLAYDLSVDDVRQKVNYDLEYLRRQSMLEDLRIMSMTIPVVLFRRGGW